MAGPIFVDRVEEITTTTGLTRPYVLFGATPGNMIFNGNVTDQDWCYIQVRDSTRKEISKARFTAPNLLNPVEYVSTTNSDIAVNWPSDQRSIIELIITPWNLFIDDRFWETIELGDSIDLGDLNDLSSSWVEMSELIAVTDVENDIIPITEMGELT